MTRGNQRSKEGRDEMGQRYLRGAARQEKRKRNQARGARGGRGLRDDLEDGFDEDEAPPRRASKSRGDERERAPRSVATVLEVARGSVALDLDGEVVEAPRSGALRGVTLAVGDELDVEVRADGPPLLRALRERRSVLTRPDPGNRHKELVVAANVDVGVVTCAASAPPFRPGLVDRYLIALERGGVRALVFVNKLDLLDDDGRAELERALAPYRELGLVVEVGSTRTGEGIAALRERLAGRTSVLVGHSGVGKSSLVNALAGEERTFEGDVRAFDGKGRHTTTSSTLHALAGGGRLIDTPGIRAFGLAGVTAADLRTDFPGLAEHARRCRFRDCAHRGEPDCGVEAAVRTGELAEARYEVYLRLCASLEEDTGG